MRRLLRHIAIAILALVGPVEAARMVVGPAVVACPCGCGATEATCPCSAKVALSQDSDQAAAASPASGEAGCSTTETASAPKPTSPLMSLTGDSQNEDGQDLMNRPEPKPWPGALPRTIQGTPVHPALGALEVVPILQVGRSMDRLARLAVFRI